MEVDNPTSWPVTPKDLFRYSKLLNYALGEYCYAMGGTGDVQSTQLHQYFEPLMQAVPATILQPYDRSDWNGGIRTEHLEKNCVANNFWLPECWQDIVKRLKVLLEQYEKVVEPVKSYALTNPQLALAYLKSAIGYFERLCVPLPEETGPCYVCQQFGPDFVFGRGGCVMPMPKSCPLCCAVGSGDYFKQIPKSYYFKAVEIDGKVYTPPNVECLQCGDTKFTTHIVRAKHTGCARRSDGKCGHEPIVRLPCHICQEEIHQSDYKKVKKFFEGLAPLYPKNCKFASVEEALGFQVTAQNDL